MRTVFTSTFAATAVLLGSFAAAQGRQSAPVNIQPPTSVDVVLFSAMNAGKVLATTDSNGRNNMDVTDLINLGKLDVVEEKCPNQTRVLLVAQGTRTPDTQDCRRRRVGAFWWGHDTALNVKLSGGGMSTGTKVGILAGGGAAAVGTAVALKGDGYKTSTPSTSTGSTGGSTGGSATGTAFNGTYAGTLTATTNTCGFSSSASVRGVLSVDANGRGTWQKTHVSAGVTFNFNVNLTISSATVAAFTASTTQQVGSQTYSITDTASISGNTLTITQLFTSTSATPCTVRYTGQLQKA